MPNRITTFHSDFRSGLQTTKPQAGAAGAAAFEEFANARVTSGACVRRPGLVRLAKAIPSDGPYCATFDGSNDDVNFPYDSRIWDLDTMAAWTLEGLSKATDLSTQSSVFSRATGTAADKDIYVYCDSTSGGRIVAEITDSAAAVTTLAITGLPVNTVIAWQLVKNSAASFTLRANGSSVSGTLASGALANTTDSLLVGRTLNVPLRFTGNMDFLRLFGYAKSDQQDGWTRLINPYARGVLACYHMELDGQGNVQDLSPFEKHALTTGSPTMVATPLAVHPVPIQAICPNLNLNNQRKLVIVAGGRVYESTLT